MNKWMILGFSHIFGNTQMLSSLAPKQRLPFRPSRDRPKLPSLETPLSAREARKVQTDQSRWKPQLRQIFPGCFCFFLMAPVFFFSREFSLKRIFFKNAIFSSVNDGLGLSPLVWGLVLENRWRPSLKKSWKPSSCWMACFRVLSKCCDCFKAKGIEHADLEAGYPARSQVSKSFSFGKPSTNFEEICVGKVLPSALGAALGNPVSLLALEELIINDGLRQNRFSKWKKGGLLEDFSLSRNMCLLMWLFRIFFLLGLQF